MSPRTQRKRGAPPDFIGIGAQRAGSTWLWNMLRSHPTIWLPPIKELHYFDRSHHYDSPSLLATSSVLRRTLGRGADNKAFRAKALRVAGRAIRAGDLAATAWAWRFARGTIDDRWYLSLFDAVPGLVRGEITPAYSILDAPDVDRVRALAPEAKIIFTMRDPIERAWSQLRLASRGGDPERFSDLTAAATFLKSPAQERRGNYLRTLELWEARYPAEQLLIGFYDDIVERPQEFLCTVLDFLGVDPGGSGAGDPLSTHYNVGHPRQLPHEVKQLLAEMYGPDLETLADRFGGHPARWRDEARAALL